MALDTEEKRWGMLGFASGPSSYSQIINPSNSDFDTEVERLALLKLYGGIHVATTTTVVLGRPHITVT